MLSTFIFCYSVSLGRFLHTNDLGEKYSHEDVTSSALMITHFGTAACLDLEKDIKVYV